MQRRPNLFVTGLGLAFALAEFAIGAFGLTEEYFLIGIVAALGVWAWTQQRALENLTFRQRAVKGFIAFAIIGLVLMVAFELGQLLGGHA